MATPMKQLALLLVLTSAISVTASAAAGHTKGRAVHPSSAEFKPGDYIWHPEISPAGPVVVIVSLPEQQMYVYRNGVRIGRSTVSTGKKGNATPTGMFTILQKKVSHESSIFKGAQMPHMQRLTVDRHCHARWSPAGLSSITRLCAAAGRFRRK